ncbi:EamA family transporter RarD [Aliikangiella coralliicola]|uniref:EamA family transporter RarD n=1 Tax=Aliikangiella coralliicola TaxID=2592383 RepID=A0A545UFN0_9GAMM|nr:EamA family transporter RarD [Aliikangiella coralliicola]TQV88193.1 EamA family transporter RarD [Aliikangiella coralliicola]
MTSKTETSGWLFGIGAFVWWGIAPVYFKVVDMVPAEEILAHRIAWCVPVTLILMWLLKKRTEIKRIISDKKLLLGLTASTALISCNWYIFTWAVTHDQILATSLGYFINPIMSILMGVILLGERLTRLQWGAVIAVTLGVANQIVNYGEFPWIALSLATSFALYGFIRKQLNVDSLNGLLVETSIALPVATGYIVWTIYQQSSVFLNLSLSIDLLLLSGGIVTAVPLIWFAAAAKKIPLNSVGFLQFIAPSITFILATQIYDEPLGSKQLMSFVFIWIGLGLYLVKPLRNVLKGSKR